MVMEPSWFQAEDRAWMQTHPRNLVCYDTGLGKTPLATWRNIDLSVGTALVTCPTSAFKTWRDHAFEMFPDTTDVDVFFVRGTPLVRKQLWGNLLQKERTNQHRLFVCTHDIFRRDLPFLSRQQLKHIDQIDIDEAHKGMRNRKSILYRTAKQICNQVGYFSFLSGTPISRGPQEFFTYLNCIEPRNRTLRSYWRYMMTFFEFVEGPYGLEMVGPKASAVENFYQLFSQYGRSRRKDDPGIKEMLPDLTRLPLFTHLTKDQARILDELETQNWALKEDGSGGIILAGGSLEQRLRFRQLLVCPKILDTSLDMGGAFNDFLDALSDPGDPSAHTVLFTPFKSAFPYLREALQKEGYSVNQLSGGITVEEQEAQIQQWKEQQGIMLCTIAYAESFTLESETCYFIGYEWDPNQNKQAEERLHRWITKHAVTAYYYRYEGTVDDELCEAVNFKTKQTTGFYQGLRDYQDRVSLLQG